MKVSFIRRAHRLEYRSWWASQINEKKKKKDACIHYVKVSRTMTHNAIVDVPVFGYKKNIPHGAEGFHFIRI